MILPVSYLMALSFILPVNGIVLQYHYNLIICKSQRKNA